MQKGNGRTHPSYFLLLSILKEIQASVELDKNSKVANAEV